MIGYLSINVILWPIWAGCHISYCRLKWWNSWLHARIAHPSTPIGSELCISYQVSFIACLDELNMVAALVIHTGIKIRSVLASARLLHVTIESAFVCCIWWCCAATPSMWWVWFVDYQKQTMESIELPHEIIISTQSYENIIGNLLRLQRDGARMPQ